MLLLKSQRPSDFPPDPAVSSAPRSSSDTGASAVEFALLVPLLFLILIGVIQYGFGLYQLQSFTSIVGDASKMAGTGIDSCATFQAQFTEMAKNNGIDPASVSTLKVDWLGPAVGGVFSAAPNADRLGLAKVTATFTPFRIGAPFVPFPKTITRTQTSPITDLGTLTGAC